MGGWQRMNSDDAPSQIPLIISLALPRFAVIGRIRIYIYKDLCIGTSNVILKKNRKSRARRLCSIVLVGGSNVASSCRRHPRYRRRRCYHHCRCRRRYRHLDVPAQRQVVASS